tara:strand:- start:1088 stop:1627 length:540 start_codon:yes stop_codon:yes gene_type:complete
MSSSPVEVVTSTSKSVMTKANLAKNKLLSLCKSENLLTCIVGALVIAYIALLDQSNAVDFFNTMAGKIIAMIVVLLAASIDMRLGLLVGVALILSIVYAAMNDEIESFDEEGFSSEDDIMVVDDDAADDDAADDDAVDDAADGEGFQENLTGSAIPIAISSEDDVETSEDFEDFAPANF